MSPVNRSRQRESIKAFLMDRKDHPTAEAVYMNIREEIPNISLATVYRNLTLLSDMGEIQRLHTGDGPDHFDGDIRPHDHFVCKACGRIYDLQSSKRQPLKLLDGSSFDGYVEDMQTFFYGKCPECLKKEAAELH